MNNKIVNGIIYMITFPNDKRYIGRTTMPLVKRIDCFKHTYNNKNSKSYNTKVCTAIRRFGFDNLLWTTIYEGPITTQHLNKMEKWYINHLTTKGDDGYNDKEGGSKEKGYTKEVRQRMSMIKTGCKHSEETKKKISQSMKALRGNDNE